MADARTGIDVVVAKPCPHQLLDEKRFFVGAAAGCDAAERVLAIGRGDPVQFGRRVGKGFVPFDFAPRIADRFADHRFQDAFLMLGIAPGEPPLDAAMPAIGLAGLFRHHPHDLFAAHFGAERAADAAIGAGGDDGAFGRADLDDLFLDQRRRWARLHTGPARYAFRP